MQCFLISNGARRTTYPSWKMYRLQYFQATLELLATHTRLSGPIAVPETPAEHDLAYRTHFERRMRLTNEPVFRAEFRKALLPFGL